MFNRRSRSPTVFHKQLTIPFLYFLLSAVLWWTQSRPWFLAKNTAVLWGTAWRWAAENQRWTYACRSTGDLIHSHGDTGPQPVQPGGDPEGPLHRGVQSYIGPRNTAWGVPVKSRYILTSLYIYRNLSTQRTNETADRLMICIRLVFIIFCTRCILSICIMDAGWWRESYDIKLTVVTSLYSHYHH